MVFLEIHSE